MVGMRWTTTVLACDQPSWVAEFWAGLLGGDVLRINENFYAVRHGSAWLGMQKASDPPAATWPSGPTPVQIHLDIAVQDLDDAVARAVELGAREEKHQPAPGSWRVLRAPGGHLFCLSEHIGTYLPLDRDDESYDSATEAWDG